MALPTFAPIATAQTDLSASAEPPRDSNIEVGHSYHNDVSPPLRELAAIESDSELTTRKSLSSSSVLGLLVPEVMPSPILVFNGISPCPGCGLPRPNGEAGATQYVQVVAQSYQVFDKATGASILGPNTIASIFSGFGGVCQNGVMGNAILLYDQMADRWLISQLAGGTGVTNRRMRCHLNHQ